jgi:hypothetical protein
MLSLLVIVMGQKMRFQIAAALLAGLGLGACMGPQGNPDGQAYATDSDGMVAAAPQALGTVSYDPYAKPPSFADMDIGSSAITPSATPPMNLTTQGAAPMPARPGPLPH